jgi:hypothetical protein
MLELQQNRLRSRVLGGRSRAPPLRIGEDATRSLLSLNTSPDGLNAVQAMTRRARIRTARVPFIQSTAPTPWVKTIAPMGPKG